MKKLKIFFIRCLVILVAVQGALAVQLLTLQPARADFSTPKVAINEVMWMGSSVDPLDQWIELRNTTENDIDLSNWTITNSANGGSGDLTIGTGTIKANSLYLISRYGKSNPLTALNVSDKTMSSLSFSSTCQVVDLKEPGVTSPVDEMGCDGTKYFFPADGAIMHSLERSLAVPDGTLATSWHEATFATNLKAGVTDLATPKSANGDVTQPDITNALVVANNGSAFTSSNTIPLTWSGFTDPESGIDHYLVGVASEMGKTTGTADIQAFQLFASAPTDLTIASWMEDVNSFVLVKAVNKAGLVSDPVASLAVLYDTTAPNPVTNLVVSDVSGDNGGSVLVKWDRSVSPDVINYQMNYRKVGDPIWTGPVNLGNVNQAEITGLDNAPASYEVEITAVDFSGLTAPVATAIGQAIDNLAPVLVSNEVVVNQNQPGTVDSIQGEIGAVSEPSIVNVFDNDPSSPTANLLGSAGSLTDGSFPAVNIDDNRYATVWIQLVDKDGPLSSAAQPFNNDIVGPASPTLENLTSTCSTTDSCRVVLSWKDNGPDTDHYQVVYKTGGVEQRTLSVTTTSIALDLSNAKSYDFSVLAYDKYGNASAESNVFFVSLNRGVKTNVALTDGQPVTTVTAISGSTAVSSGKSSSKSTLVPVAQAAEPTSTPSPSSTPVETQGTSQDWLRIFVVVILLLIVAGGFYALSRSFKDTEELDAVPAKPVKPSKGTKPAPKKKVKRRSTRRR